MVQDAEHLIFLRYLAAEGILLFAIFVIVVDFVLDVLVLIINMNLLLFLFNFNIELLYLLWSWEVTSLFWLKHLFLLRSVLVLLLYDRFFILQVLSKDLGRRILILNCQLLLTQPLV